MMNIFFKLVLVGCIAGWIGPLAAQKKVLGRPVRYEAPVDFFYDANLYESFLRNDTKLKSKEDAWLAICDRDDNPVYELPDENSPVLERLKFRESFYVLDEKEDWIQLADAQVDGVRIVQLNRVLGWVPKKLMLLWNTSLVHQQNKIHKKALLLNRADDIAGVLKLQDKTMVQIFKGPQTETQEEKRKIFEFYFIMKKESGRYLLSEESVISPFSLDKIIGWVNERRCSNWDTRICLEPNFEEPAFTERKNKEQLQLRAFKSEASAKQYAEEITGDDDVFWKDDPVTLNQDKMSSLNPRRFNGYVMRFPMLGVSSKKEPDNKQEFYRSGIIGSIKVRRADNNSMVFTSEISESNYSRIKQYVNQADKKTDNLNVFFVIEGTDSTFAYKNSLVQAVTQVESWVGKTVPNIRYGALLYRDIPEEEGEKGNRLYEMEPLTPDVNKVTGFIQQAEFRNYNDRDEYTALYYGLSQALMLGRFDPEALNVLILIGSYSDYKIDRDRKAAAAAVNHKSLVEDLNPLFGSLAALDVHLYAIQLRNDGNKQSAGFAKQGQVLILESAKYAFNRFYGNRGNPDTRELLQRLNREYKIAVNEPSMADIFEADDIPLAGGRNPGRLLKPAENRYLPPNRLVEAISANIRESVAFEVAVKTIVNDIFIKGESLQQVYKEDGEFKIDAGRFTPALADMLNTMVQENSISQTDLFNSLDDKYKLFTEVYIPRMVRGATYPTVSYVLFMPESDLVEYQRIIQRYLGSFESSYDKKREHLFEIYKELVTQFSGETILRQKKADEFTRSELVQLMQGLYGSGLHIDLPLDIRIKDIRDENKVSNADVDELLNRFKAVEQMLTSALRASDTYDFCYKTDANNRYYWIPLTDAF